MSFLRTLARSRVTSLSSPVDNCLLKSEISRRNALLKANNKNNAAAVVANVQRGIKTTSTTHPKPVYQEDEKILDKVMEERLKQSEDLPIGMANPYEKPQRKCILCENKVTPNFKNIKLLSQFISPYTGLMYDRHVTGLCAKQHDLVEKQIGIALRMGLVSNYVKLVEFLKDPKICDPERPLKPHKY